jgi:hypothetical protein
MATKLVLRNTTLNGIVDAAIASIIYDMVTAFGSSVDTAVTDTAASGTEIQLTKTSGGSTVAWVSGRVPAGGFTLTTSDISAWFIESSMNANAGGRLRVYKYSGGSLTEIGGGPFDDGVEFSSTSDTEMTWLANVTDTALAEDDRIVVKLFLTNVGTMAGGFTCTHKFNAADAATGDSFFNINETVTFKPENQTISGVGAMASDEAFGTLGANFTVNGVGNIASGEAFGSDQLTFTLPAVGGLASSEAFGTLSANFTINGVGAIASGEAFGAHTLSGSGPQTVTATGVATDEAFGTLSANFTISGVGAITTGEAFGTLSANFSVTGVGAIASAEAFGTLSANLNVSGAGNIATGEAFGTNQLNLGLSGAGAIASGEAFGVAQANLNVSGAGNIASAEAFGSPVLNFILAAFGVASDEAFGSTVVSPGPVTITATGITSDEAFGLLALFRALSLPAEIAITVSDSGEVSITVSVSGELRAEATQEAATITIR